jgi:hypothetical protein
MAGYMSKKLMAQSRESDFTVPDVDYHYRENDDMIMEKMNENLFYNLRHLKKFKELVRADDKIWRYEWPEFGNIKVYDKTTNTFLFELGYDVQLAEYIVCLHNMSARMIKEIESKYDRSF